MASGVVALLLTGGVPPAGASVTLGELGTNTDDCGAFVEPIDYIQAPVTLGNSYEVPGNGRITSWSNNAATGIAGQLLKLKVFRKIADPNIFRVVGHDGPQALSAGILNTFPVDIPVQRGDVVGLGVPGSSDTSCVISPFGGSAGLYVFDGDLPDGQATSFGGPAGSDRLNLTATFVPSNSVTLGAKLLNKKKGTATLSLTLPNPGELTASGRGVRVTSTGSSATSTAVGAGAAQLLIKAKGRKATTLRKTGKVKVGVTITYMPVNGEPENQSVKVKLQKK